MMQDPGRDLQWSVRTWIEAWGTEVANVELGTARRRFDEDVVAFGTYADVVSGLDALHDEQWSRIWPTIRDFRFLTDELVVQASPDGLQAVAIVPWDSTGVAADGSEFRRPGRATVVLRRRSTASPWLGTHTHFSLARDVPSTSHGARS
jgi:ketosteroid isomerase-like protein